MGKIADQVRNAIKDGLAGPGTYAEYMAEQARATAAVKELETDLAWYHAQLGLLIATLRSPANRDMLREGRGLDGLFAVIDVLGKKLDEWERFDLDRGPEEWPLLERADFAGAMAKSHRPAGGGV